MDWLYSVYIGTSIFGVGVTVVDFLGFLGNHESDGESDGDGSGTDDAGDTGEVETDADGDSHMDSGDDDGDSTDDSDGDHTDDSDESDSIESHNISQSDSDRGALIQSHQKKNPILKILSAMRYFVYFSLGFGPIGLMALATGSTILSSLFWSLPIGTVSLIITTVIKKLQTRTLDSQVKESDLLMEKAEVIVPIEKGRMGKVRVLLGSSHVERYAKAADPQESFITGSILRVVDIEKEFVIVSDE